MNTKTILENLSNTLLSIITTSWSSTGIDKNSDLIKSLNVEYNNSKGLIVYANSYAENIQKGRKKYAKKLPISFLIEFIKKQGINPKSGQSINSLAYAIQNQIYLNGIKGKNIIKSVEQPATKILTPIIDKQILNQINNLINGK